ncbi:hypothetical protein [uncultured Gammaproteobacteria bacterium]|nr:hypothetical protein [uncultured Gammaproteobacteria bacterium]CAC9505070.1 hypothetical protein [uncultured Gammaproteobacteria bacterium]CAC9506009.1 hypothetical protein [uncultured Gammaproteobacteria bacterium]CAC9528592.1 hypothetical protein [uncultured Gammaproteobacteria bacterium]
MGWFFRILIGIFWVGWFYFWIWVLILLKSLETLTGEFNL